MEELIQVLLGRPHFLLLASRVLQQKTKKTKKCKKKQKKEKKRKKNKDKCYTVRVPNVSECER